MLGRERYYVDEGKAHDDLLRCKDCQALVTFQMITKLGCCDKCGNKRFNEITLLNDEEMADIQSAKIDFPSRELFLAEFSAIDPNAPPVEMAATDPMDEFMRDMDLTKPAKVDWK